MNAFSHPSGAQTGPRGGGSRVRVAEGRDAATVEAMIRAVARESLVHRRTAIDDAKLKGFIRHAIAREDHVVLLHQRPDGVDGVYIGVVMAQFYTLELTGMDLLFYVRPESRGGRAAVRLWRAFDAWARARGAKTFLVGAMTGIDPARTGKFYRGMGLSEVGGLFHAHVE